MRASEETVRLIWKGLLNADGMHRYYGYLSGRLERLGDLFHMAVAMLSFGALAALLAHLPMWVPAASMALATLSAIIVVCLRYPAKAARSAEIHRRIGRLAGEWERLWIGVYDKDDAELRAAWGDLARRQAVVVERAPHELPLSHSLARRSYREADSFWVESSASA